MEGASALGDRHWAQWVEAVPGTDPEASLPGAGLGG